MKKFFKVISVVIIMLILAAIVCKALQTEIEVVDTEKYVVSRGDTLWDIAKTRINKSIDIRDYIDLIYENNEGLTPNIKPGQIIILPILSGMETKVVEEDTTENTVNIESVTENTNTPTPTVEIYEPKPTVKYTPLEVPDIDSSFKTWMSYKAVTNKQSAQYKFINTYGWSDSEGFMRCTRDQDYGIEQDYYLIALGSYYGITIGTKYRITLDTGNVFYGVLADCKDDRHTNSTNQYVPVNRNVVEFIVDTSKLNKSVKRMGSANVYAPLNGKVVKIEKMDFVLE